MEPEFFNILLQCDYQTIINAGNASIKFFTICKSLYFWQEKAVLDFSIDPVAFKSITARDNKARYEYLINVNKHQGLLDYSRKGKIKLVEYFLNMGANLYNWAMGYAASGGYMDIVKLMISLGGNDYNWTMISAAEGGHIDIVKLMLSLGARDFNNEVMRSAQTNGHIDIVNLLKQYI